MSAIPTVAVTMVVYERQALTLRCLEALRQNTARPFSLTVVDNGSSPALRDSLRRLKSDGLIDNLFFNRRNMGVCVAANLGWSLCESDYYLKLDNDVLARSPLWLDRLVDTAEEGGFAVTAFRLCAWHGADQATLPSGRAYLATGAVGGACALIPRRIHEELGFWNEDYSYGWEDLEYGNRAALAGHKLAYALPEDAVEHLGPEADNRLREYQAAKDSKVKDTSGPLGLFLLNTMMFELKLRPLRVERKFLPEFLPDGAVSYKINPDYQNILVRQKLFRERFVSSANGNDIYLKNPA